MAISDARTKQADKDLQKNKTKKQVHIRIKGPLPSPGLKSESTKHMNKVDPLKKI